MAKCRANKRSGERCKANATANGKCLIHQDRDKARDLARRSVDARRRAAAEAHAQSEIVAPKTPAELVNELAQVFAELKSGKLDVAVGRTMANVGMVILKGFEVVDIKKQLEEIEGLLKQRS